MDREKVIKWFEYDYFPRVGAYRKDCKQGCDACVPMHDGDDYCDIDMLCKVLDLLKEQDQKTGHWIATGFGFGKCSECGFHVGNIYVSKYCQNCGAKMMTEVWE